MSSIREKLSSNTTAGTELSFLRERYDPIKVDIGEVKRLDNYNEFGRYYQTPEGNFPSVTTALGSVADKQFLVDWRERIGREEADKISHIASSYGNTIHSMIENSILDRPFKVPTLYRNVPRLIRKTLHNHIGRIALVEEFLYSKKLKIAGTVDCLAKWDGVWSIVDWKTSRNEKKREWIDGYFEQAFLYACMVQEQLGITVKQLVIPVFYLDQTSHDVFIEKPSNIQQDIIDRYKQIKQRMSL